MKQTYITDSIADDDEQKRLRLLEELHDPPTQAALRDGGLAAGQTVLEIGPGRGSILRWIASEVGPQGKVVGLDKNPRFLTDLDLPNATVVKGDVYTADLDDAPFDLVYARFILLHLPDPVQAVRRMFELLKPGGKIVAIDVDFISHVACDPDHPAAAKLDELNSAKERAMLDCGLMDLRMGRRLPALLREARFAGISISGMSYLVEGGADDAWWWVRNAEMIVRAGIEHGALTDDTLRLTEVYNDPTFDSMAPLMVTAFGERPVH